MIHHQVCVPEACEVEVVAGGAAALVKSEGSTWYRLFGWTVTGSVPAAGELVLERLQDVP